jgi:hypothetical protein
MKKKLIVEVFRKSGLKALLDQQNVPEGMMMVEGVLGRVDSENRNKRYYPREEYAKHVKLMQERIQESNGIFGEMEHPKSMNIDLNNVSHKVVDVRLDEDGFVRGRVLLLDTPKGKIAQSIVKTGSPLPISSRAVGQVSESGEVKLDLLSTYDLVGTAGFAEAKLGKAPLMESLDESGNVINETYITDLDSNGDAVEESTIQEIVEAVETRLRKSFVHKDEVDALVEQRVAAQGGATINENGETVVGLSENQVLALMNERFANVYSPILERWITQEFAPTNATFIQEWLTNDYANLLESWVKDDVLPHHSNVIEQWVKEDVLPHNAEVTENWIKSEVLPHNAEVTETWIKSEVLPHNAEITETWLKQDALPEFGEVVQEWLVGDYANVLEGWIKNNAGTIALNEAKETEEEEEDPKKSEKSEEKGEEKKKDVKESIMETADLFTSKLLMQIDENVEKAKELKASEKKEEKIDEAYFRSAPTWLRRIPAEFKPMWTSLNESQRDKVFKRAAVRLLETDQDVRRFWKSIDFETIIEGQKHIKREAINESINEPVKSVRHGVGAFAKFLQK